MNRTHFLHTARSAALPAALVTMVGASVALAQTTVPLASAPAAPSMSFQQVVDRVAALGFRDVREVERKSDKLYGIKARDDKGQRVEPYVDARSGEVQWAVGLVTSGDADAAGLRGRCPPAGAAAGAAQAGDRGRAR